MSIITTHRGDFYVANAHYDTSIPPLLLIHGAGGSRLDFPKSVRQLPCAGSIALDLSAHGQSQKVIRQSIADHAEDVISVIQAMGYSQVYILGHSLGGAIALTAAHQAPSLVRGLILVGSGAKLVVNRDLLHLLRTDADQAVEWLIDSIFSKGVNETLRAQSRRAIHALGIEVLRADFESADGVDLRDLLPQLMIPTLVIQGGQDKMSPLHYGEYLAEHLPSATLATIPEAGHHIMREFPDLTAKTICSWLRRQEGKS